MKEPKQMSVSAIQNGTVIDHVPASNLFKVIQILGLDRIENQITFGTNLESKNLEGKQLLRSQGYILKMKILTGLLLLHLMPN
jgi:aspartate carbamoyltransferase regulatory subunit